MIWYLNEQTLRVERWSGQIQLMNHIGGSVARGGGFCLAGAGLLGMGFGVLGREHLDPEALVILWFGVAAIAVLGLALLLGGLWFRKRGLTLFAVDEKTGRLLRPRSLAGLPDGEWRLARRCGWRRIGGNQRSWVEELGVVASEHDDSFHTLVGSVVKGYLGRIGRWLSEETGRPLIELGEVDLGSR